MTEQTLMPEEKCLQHHSTQAAQAFITEIKEMKKRFGRGEFSWMQQ